MTASYAQKPKLKINKIMKKGILITLMSATMMFVAANISAQTVAATKLEPAKKVENCECKKSCENCAQTTCQMSEGQRGKYAKGKNRHHRGGKHMMKPTEEAVKNLKAYPETVGDMERHVIYLSERKNEEAFKVELIPGKVMEVDCNQHRLMGAIKEETVQGWGYTYLTFETNGQTASTMMMCPDPKTEKFVSGATEMVRYNSRLPIVVYLPKGVELRYKIWSAGRLSTAEQQ